MALRAGYWGIKKLLSPLKLIKPGELGIDNDALAKDFFPRSEQEIYGAYNVIPYPFDGGGALQTVTLTSDDGVMNLNGTVTGGNMRYDLTNSSGNTSLAGLRGKWKLTVEGALPGDAVISIRKSNEAAVWSCAGNSEITIDFTDEVHTTGWIYLHAPTGTQFSNNTVKVMLSKNGGSFVPYAMTNKELTELAKAISTANDGVIQVGNLVVVNKVFTLTSNLASGWNENRTDITFPKPIAYVPVLIYSGTSYYQGLLGTAGNNIKISSAVNSGDTITICAAYIAEASAANRSLPDANREAVPDVKEIIDEPVVEKTTTKKSTKKTASADNNE